MDILSIRMNEQTKQTTILLFNDYYPGDRYGRTFAFDIFVVSQIKLQISIVIGENCVAVSSAFSKEKTKDI